MRQLLVMALSTLLLAGCIAQWPSHRTGSRWHGGPDAGSVNTAPSCCADVPGQPHGIGF